MACAGYLVRNNTTVVYAEVVNGLLVCTPAALHRAAAAAASPLLQDEPNGTTSEGLPLLAPKRMERAASFIVDKLAKRRASEASTQPEDEPLVDDDDDDDDDEAQVRHRTKTTTNVKDEKSRVLQLSGHVIEVVDCAREADDSCLVLLPFSFRVHTKRMTLHADASFSFSPADTLLLAAPDQATKDEWMKRLARWNRYGWRETTLLAATDEDADILELALQRWRDSEACNVLKPAAEVFGYAAAAVARSSTSRRRFYRHTGSNSAAYAPVENPSNDAQAAWFQTRVVKTHI